MRQTLRSQAGIGIIEILIAIFIISLAFSSLAVAGTISSKLLAHQKNILLANYLSQESIEVVRSIWEEDWNILATLDTETSYHQTKTGTPTKWTLTLGTQTINGFERQVIISDVYRDAHDNIVFSGGVLDPGTKKVTSRLVWTEKERNYEVELVNYLTNWK